MSPRRPGRWRRAGNSPALAAAPVVDADRYDRLLREAAGVGGALDPLPAELAVSRALVPSAGGTRRAAFASLAAYLQARDGPDAAALLRAAAVLGPDAGYGTVGGDGGDGGNRAGDAPPWAADTGRPAPGPCWRYGDVFGDQESVVCTFAYPGRGVAAGGRTHALVALVDRNLGGIVKDLFCTERPRRTLEAIRMAHAEDGPMSVLEEIPPARAAAVLRRAFTATEDALEPPVGERGWALWALARSRLTRLPGGDGGGGGGGSDGCDPHVRAVLVAEFLASPHSEALPDRAAAAACARLLVDYGCDHDSGQPLRVSPAKTELLLLYWLPRGAGLAATEVAAMPDVARAWVAFAAERRGLPDPALREVLAAADDCARRFPVVYEGSAGAG